MIQRVQTLFLLGVVIISIVLFFIPLSQKTFIDSQTGSENSMVLNIDKTHVIKADKTETIENNFLLLSLNLLIIVLSATAIFLYKNRRTQMMVCMITTLFSIGMMMLIFYYSDKMGMAETKAHYEAGVYLIALQVVFTIAARKFINKDDMMVRAADRIR